MTTRRGFVATAVAAGLSITGAARALADGIQTVTNRGQIVSTGDVNVRQAAGGYQYLDGQGNWVAVQSVENGLQIVSTGNVNADQSAAGYQAAINSGGGGNQICTPGEYTQQGDCVIWCASDGCSYKQFCCGGGNGGGKCSGRHCK